MTREQIIRMAREQGLPETEVEGVFRVNSDDLGRMLAAEREACAKLCEELRDDWLRGRGRYEFMGEGADYCADAIRARGQS